MLQDWIFYRLKITRKISSTNTAGLLLKSIYDLVAFGCQTNINLAEAGRAAMTPRRETVMRSRRSFRIKLLVSICREDWFYTRKSDDGMHIVWAAGSVDWKDSFSLPRRQVLTCTRLAMHAETLIKIVVALEWSKKCNARREVYLEKFIYKDLEWLNGIRLSIHLCLIFGNRSKGSWLDYQLSRRKKC